MKDNLIHGIGYSVALLSRDLYSIQEAGQLIKETGYGYNDFVKAKLPEYDLKEIKKVFEEELRNANSTTSEKNGCGKEIQPHPKVKMPCGEIAGGKQVYCEDCENDIESTEGEQ